jgi:hypothetical protein
MISSSVWEIKEKTFVPVQTENGDFLIYANKNYQTAQLKIKFENQIPENFTAQIQKDFSIFSKTPKKGIYSKEDLGEKNFKNNPSLHSNGSFLKYDGKIYFLDEGKLRKLDNAEILNFFNLTKQQLTEITFEEFNKLSQGKILEYKSFQEEFPENILIKKGAFFYITNDNSYQPIHIPNPEEFQKKLNLQLSTLSGKWETGKCFKIKDKTTNCDFDLRETISDSGNIYRIQIDNKTQKINKIKARFENNFNPSEIINEIKELFLK